MNAWKTADAPPEGLEAELRVRDGVGGWAR